MKTFTTLPTLTSNMLFSMFFIVSTALLTAKAVAEDKIELDTTTIKGNTELPKVLYVVPWQDAKSNGEVQQKLALHSLFGDLFEPHMPEPPRAQE
jgi:hypothetical protein